MTTDHQHVLMAEIFLNPLPDSIRNEILRDEEFCTRIRYKPALSMSLDPGISVQMENLHKTLRSAITKRSTSTLILADGTRKRVKLRFEKPGTATILVEGKRFSFADADLLSHDKRMRTSGLHRVLARQPLLEDEQDAWRRIAKSRPFTDREFVRLMTALHSTPEAVMEELCRPQSLTVEKLIPDESEYYQRLTAAHSSKRTFPEYLKCELAQTRGTLLKRNRALGLRRIAFSGLSHALVPLNLLSSVNQADLAPLINANDPFSILCGFEVAGARVRNERGFAEIGEKFLEKLFADSEATMARCTIFSACALASIVKLRTVFSEQDVPLYWFRLAALSHAGVLTEALASLRKPDEFFGWAKQQLGADFVWHAAVDVRDAPRWDLEWLKPEQIQAELLGRALHVINLLPKGKRPKKWVTLIAQATAQISKPGRELAPHFPGPMDDFATPIAGVKRDPALVRIGRKLKKARSLEEVPELAALAYLERPSQNLAEEVRRLLAKHGTDDHQSEKEQSSLRLYAYIAASARSEPLANEVISRCLQIARTQKLDRRTISTLLLITITASGAASTDDRYRTILGDAATKLAYSTINEKPGRHQLRQVIETLGARAPKLISVLSRATAILDTQ